jgi:UDP-N-acetylmuramoyl-L-alanyl-D-glutamate--2,6-diaminopimelate ligase
VRLDSQFLGTLGATAWSDGIDAVECDAVTADSREVRPGTVFVAIRGGKTDGHAFVATALAAGASFVVIEDGRDAPSGPFVRVKNVRLALALLATLFAGDPTASLALVGITGTDGKTSTAMILEAGFSGVGISSGLIGTVTYRIAGEELPAPLTTPDPVQLNALFRRMVDRGVRAAAMEVSSHALDQRRVEGCRFDAAVFTLLARDHLDYHGTVDAYADAKLRLFSEVLPAGGKARGAMVNGDDPMAARIRAVCPVPVLSWSHRCPDADVRPRTARFDANGIEAVVATPWGDVPIRSRLIGPHNLSNFMAALGVAGILGLPLGRFADGACALRRIPGRLERVDGRRPVHVFVDYAHTPKAVENVLTVLRSLVPTGARILAVVGAGGDRDRGKRPLMGRAAVGLADEVVITSDNPRTEDPLAILADIAAGIESARAEGVRVAPFRVEPDRRRAIGLAIDAARVGDAVVICGKGHETYQIFGEVKHHFSDVETAGEFMDA